MTNFYVSNNTIKKMKKMMNTNLSVKVNTDLKLKKKKKKKPMGEGF